MTELRELADAGIALAYVGAESGDDRVLKMVNKGETHDSTLDGLQKLREASIGRSVMILNGLGGGALSACHADGSAKLANAVQPEFLSTLVVTFPKAERRFRSAFSDWQPLALDGSAREMECFLSQLELARTTFRSDHASNWLVLKGTLNTDKERLLTQMRAAIENPQAAVLRPAWARRL